MTLTSPLSTAAPRPTPITAIAIGASIGVHGVLFALLPLLPNPAERIRDTTVEPVPVVELSALEQQRLPDLDRPQFTGLPNDGSTQFGLTPPPPNGSLFPNPTTQLPQTPTGRSRFTPRPAVPRTMVPRTMPRTMPRSSGRSPMIIQPPSRSAVVPGVPRQPSSQLPSVLPGTPTTPSNLPNNGGLLGQGDIAFSDAIPELDALGLNNSSNPDFSASTSASALPSLIEPNVDADGNPIVEPTPNDPETGDPEATTTPDNSTDTAVNPDVADGSESGDRDAAPMGELRAELNELQAYVAAPDPGLLVDQSVAIGNAGDWLAANELALATDKAPIELSIPYELDICAPREAPQFASVYAVIDPIAQTLISSPPELFKSTGYVGLDDAAIAAVEDYIDRSTIELAASDQNLSQVVIQFRVDVEYNEENCLPGLE